MADDDYTKNLEKIIKQMLLPLKNIPFKLVIESLTGKEVLPFNKDNLEHYEILKLLNIAARKAGNLINDEGIKRRRVDEVGNAIEAYVKTALNECGLKADTPAGQSGKKKSTGYPDIIFWHKDKPYYLECKTYSKENMNTTFRSFYLSPSKDFKVTYSTLHFLLSYEMFISDNLGNQNTYKAKHYKILSIEKLHTNVKYEFNTSNKELYKNDYLLAEGDLKL
jgi:hypothetical protein